MEERIERLERVLDVLEEPGVCGVDGVLFDASLSKYKRGAHPRCITGALYAHILGEDMMEAEYQAIRSVLDEMDSEDMTQTEINSVFINNFNMEFNFVSDEEIQSQIEIRFGLLSSQQDQLQDINDGLDTPEERKEGIREYIVATIEAIEQAQYVGEGV